MNVTPIKFAGKTAPGKLHNMAMDVGFSYCAPVTLPKPVRFFDKEFDYFEVGMRGQLRLGKWEDELVDNPLSMSDFKFGNILVPVGERLTTRACSTYIYMWMEHNVIYLSFKLKDEHTRRLIYIWQVQFPLNQPNVVEFHYHTVQTGFNTLVGVRGEAKDDIIEYFNFKADESYPRTALRFDTTPAQPQEGPLPSTDPTVSPDHENASEHPPAQPPRPGFKWVRMSTPMGYIWKEVKDPQNTPGASADKWATVWQGNGYRVQEALK